MNFTGTRQTLTAALGVAFVMALAAGAAGCSQSLPVLSHSKAEAPPATASASAPPPVPQVAAPFNSPPVLKGTPDIAAIARRLQPGVVNITTKSTVAVPAVPRSFDSLFGPLRRRPSWPWSPDDSHDNAAVRTRQRVSHALAAAAEHGQPALLKVCRNGHDRFVALQAPS